MRGPEKGFLLLASTLGDPQRRILSTPQLRTLANRVRNSPQPLEDRDLTPSDLVGLGYSREMAARILHLLSEETVLEYYLNKGSRFGCTPLTPVSNLYPPVLKEKLGQESPGVLWAKGELQLLQTKKIGLVGSRDLNAPNERFAQTVGQQAALQGYTLVSGNARGADRTAQDACLQYGGSVIIVVADQLSAQPPRENVLYLSEESFDLPFSAQRALSRNRVIHALAEKTLVAQCALETGGTWDGTVKNLRFGWSDVFCLRDGSAAMKRLEQMGASLVDPPSLYDLAQLKKETFTLFDRV